ncbi:Conserved_hypothetical protein [Hexamita inflata]|uniref:Uncharacterized protein n=1 Tax=Hexamita inflata TaxID=28002 RepID=A0AA86TT94_9EUKA|nr:Conserved hypothetical protein [Hexamita inflata]
MFNGINDVIIFSGDGKYSSTPLFISSTKPLKDLRLFVNDEYICDVTQVTADEPFSKIVGGRQLNNKVQQYSNDISAYKNASISLCARKLQNKSLNSQNEQALFTQYQVPASLLEHMDPEQVHEHALYNNNCLTLDSSISLNPSRVYANSTTFSPEMLEKIVSLFKKDSHLNGKISQFEFKLFISGGKRVIFADIDGTLTKTDMCIFCPNKPTINKINNLRTEADVYENGAEVKSGAEVLPIMITTRHYLYKRTSRKNALQFFGKIVPALHTPRNNLFFPPHPFRAAIKQIMTKEILNAAKEVGITQSYAFGNTKSDMTAFVLAGCDHVEIV